MKDISPNPIVARIDEVIAKRGMSRRGLSIKAGLSPEFVRKIHERGPDASTSIDNIRALADALGMTVQELLPDMDLAEPSSERQQAQKGFLSDVPILGTANGSAIGAFQLSNDPIGYAPRPPGLAQVAQAYALYIRNDSMAPKHPQGDLVFVHPFKPPRQGDSVIIQTVNSEGGVEAFIKTLGKETPEWHIFHQLNPAAELKFKPSTVRYIHKVLTTAEMFGV